MRGSTLVELHGEAEHRGKYHVTVETSIIWTCGGGDPYFTEDGWVGVALISGVQVENAIAWLLAVAHLRNAQDAYNIFAQYHNDHGAAQFSERSELLGSAPRVAQHHLQQLVLIRGTCNGPFHCSPANERFNSSLSPNIPGCARLV